MSLTGARAVLRISRRNVARSRWRSALIVILITLPVAGMSAGVTYLATTAPDPETTATQALGRAHMLVYAQTPDATASDLRAVLPAGSVIEPLALGEAGLQLPGRQLRVSLRQMDLDGLAQGMLRLVAGRTPRNDAEVAVSPSVAALDLELGSHVEMDDGVVRTVVGIVENPARLSQRLVLRPIAADTFIETWLVSLPDGAELLQRGGAPDEQAVPLEPAPEAGEVDLGPDFYARTRDDWLGRPAGATGGVVVFGALVLIESVLVAAAAFAVSIRRRQRELGILAAAGAQPRHLAGTVLGEGLLLGGIGAALGALLGFGAVLAASPMLDHLLDRRVPPVALDLPGLLLSAIVGLLAALIAATVPAWSAARLPVLAALSGRRPPSARARRVLAVGMVLVVVSVALTAYGASILLVDPSQGSALVMLVAGAIIGVLGFGAASPWLIERLEAIGRRLPLAPRLAFRDAARARSRSAPIVTAMLAGLAATVAAGALITSYFSYSASQWEPTTRPDQLFVVGQDAAVAGPFVVREMGAIAGAPITELNRSPEGGYLFIEIFYTPAGEAPSLELDEHGQPICGDCLLASRVTLASNDLLAALAAEEAAPALLAGRAVILTKDPLSLSQVSVVIWRQDGVEVTTLPASAVAVGVDPNRAGTPGVLVTEALAAKLRVRPDAEDGYLIRLPRAVTDVDVSRAGMLVSEYPETYAYADVGPLRPEVVVRWAATVLSFILTLSVAAVAVALGEAEARADQRTLLAVGADPRIRRRIAAARAGVLALLAGVLAVPAGLLPAWGLLSSRETPLVIPIPELAVALVLLPAAAVAGALLLSRPIPAWSAFRDVAAG